jgi:BirA family biotin operon repressor/biotin-[acetyl-CoA-carboxylase] ligase
MAISEDISFIDQAGSIMLFYTPVCTSTQSVALQCAECGAIAPPFALYTLEQKQGRGQQNRNWISEPGKNLAMTLAVQLTKSQNLVLLNKALTLACLDFIHSLGIENAKIKWPNDIRLRGAKLAGILLESTPLNNGILLMAGFGINLNQQEFDNIDQFACSVRQINNMEYSISDAALGLCRMLDSVLMNLEQKQTAVNERFDLNLEGLGEIVNVEFSNSQLKSAVLLGSDEFGRIKLRLENGQIAAFHHGEVRLGNKK